MKALTWQGIGQVAYEDVPDPVLQNPDDAIVRVERSAVCGSDLHAYRGRIRGLVPGTILGHEYVGQVVDVGSAVTEFRPGDPVFGSFSTACGRCWPCRRG